MSLYSTSKDWRQVQAAPSVDVSAETIRGEVMAKYLILVLVVLMAILMYSLCVVSKDADRRANEMYEKWKEEHDDDRETGADDI